MDSAEELQQLEITALQSIYDKDFIECPPLTVWKVAAHLIFGLHKVLTIHGGRPQIARIHYQNLSSRSETCVQD